MSNEDTDLPGVSNSSNDITPQKNNIQNDNHQEWEVNNPNATYDWSENKFVYSRKQHHIETTNLENKSGFRK